MGFHTTRSVIVLTSTETPELRHIIIPKGVAERSAKAYVERKYPRCYWWFIARIPRERMEGEAV